MPMYTISSFSHGFFPRVRDYVHNKDGLSCWFYNNNILLAMTTILLLAAQFGWTILLLPLLVWTAVAELSLLAQREKRMESYNGSNGNRNPGDVDSPVSK